MPEDFIPAPDPTKKAKAAFTQNGFVVHEAANGDEVVAKVKELIPPGSEVMTMNSMSLQLLGIAEILNDSGDYDSIRKRMADKENPLDAKARRRLANTPDFSIGSANAITENGELVFGSTTGSQMASHVYGAGKVVLVISWHKLVPDLEAAFKRIEEYVFPLENERAMKAYGTPAGINKLLIIRKEAQPDRIHLILVDEPLGF